MERFPTIKPGPNPRTRQPVVDAPPSDSPYDRGRRDLDIGDYAGAEAELGSAIMNGQGNSNTLAAYASAAYHLKDFGTAAKAAQLSLQQDPDNRWAKSILGFARGRIGESIPSATNALSAMEKPSDDAGTPSRTPGAAARAPVGDAAATPDRQSAALVRDAQRINGLDYSAAAAEATKAIAKDPNNAHAYVTRATAYNHLGLYDRAVADADEVLRRFPDNPAALLTRAFALNRLRRFDAARADVEKILDRGRGDVDPALKAYAWLMAAYAEAGLGLRENMARSVQEAVKLRPSFQPFARRIAEAPQAQDALALFDQFENPQATGGGVAGGPALRDAARAGRTRFILGLLGAALLALGIVAWTTRGRWTTELRRGADAPGDPRRRGTGRNGSDRVPGAREAPADPRSTEGADGGFAVGYEAVRELGAGGMGIVYEARDLGLDRRVAAKRMREEIRRDPRERARFVSEARTVARLRHPGIVEIYSIIDEDDELYLVFEYVDGETLHQRIRRRGRLPFEEARRLLRAVCDAVDYAHRHGVIHRDLKPSNIMLAADGAVKVMDFGIARQAKESMTKLALTHTIAGTPAYMAPEQEQGKVGRETDVFALGACLYEMLTGELPFEGQGAGMHLNKAQGRYVPLARRLPGVPAGLEAAMSKALAPDPERRFRTAAELAAALEAVAPTPVA